MRNFTVELFELSLNLDSLTLELGVVIFIEEHIVKDFVGQLINEYWEQFANFLMLNDVWH